MATLIIRDVPEEVAKALAHMAIDAGMSRESYLRQVLHDHAAKVAHSQMDDEKVFLLDALGRLREMVQASPEQATATESEAKSE